MSTGVIGRGARGIEWFDSLRGPRGATGSRSAAGWGVGAHERRTAPASTDGPERYSLMTEMRPPCGAFGSSSSRPPLLGGLRPHPAAGGEDSLSASPWPFAGLSGEPGLAARERDDAAQQPCASFRSHGASGGGGGADPCEPEQRERSLARLWPSQHVTIVGNRWLRTGSTCRSGSCGRLDGGWPSSWFDAACGGGLLLPFAI